MNGLLKNLVGKIYLISVMLFVALQNHAQDAPKLPLFTLNQETVEYLSLIHISEPTRPY